MISIADAEHWLGHWKQSLRTLTLSAIHIERDPWLSVMDTLRHEMAHQYADEVLKAFGERPHGTSFQAACKRLRCSPRAQGILQQADDSNQGGTDQAKILRVLKKLLSLADSPNEHEAQAAVQKARQFLVKYNIDVVKLDENRQFDSRCVGMIKARHTSAEIWMASMLNRFFFVETIWTHSYDAKTNKTGTILQMFGTSNNLDMAEYVYGFLLDLLDTMWAAYKKANRLGGNKQRQRYFAGVLEGCYQKLQDQDVSLQKARSLVWKGDPQLQTYFRHINPHVRTTYGGGGAQTAVYVDGLEAGRHVTIRKPITGISSPAFVGCLPLLKDRSDPCVL